MCFSGQRSLEIGQTGLRDVAGLEAPQHKKQARRRRLGRPGRACDTRFQDERSCTGGVGLRYRNEPTGKPDMPSE